MFTNAGAPIVYGADSQTDFSAHRRISLTKEAGRVLAGVSGSHLIGTFLGEETHTQLANEVGSHTHDGASGQNFVMTSGGGVVGIPAGSGNQVSAITGDVTGAHAQPFNIMQPTVFMNVFMKL